MEPDKVRVLKYLQRQLEKYRTERNSTKTNLVDVLMVGFDELEVREAVKLCRINYISEEEILKILGEDINLGDGETRIEQVVTVKVP